MKITKDVTLVTLSFSPVAPTTGSSPHLSGQDRNRLCYHISDGSVCLSSISLLWIKCWLRTLSLAWWWGHDDYGWPEWSSPGIFTALAAREMQRLLRCHWGWQVGCVRRKSDNFLNQSPQHFTKYWSPFKFEAMPYDKPFFSLLFFFLPEGKISASEQCFWIKFNFSLWFSEG